VGDRREYVMARGKPRMYSDVANEMANRLSNLPNYECWCKLVKGGSLVEHYIATEPITKAKDPQIAKEIIDLSRKLANSREEVENSIRLKMDTSRVVFRPKAFESVKKVKKKGD